MEKISDKEAVKLLIRNLKRRDMLFRKIQHQKYNKAKK